MLQDKRFKVCAGPVCAPAEGVVGYGVCSLPKRLRILGPMRMQAVGRANGEGGQEGRDSLCGVLPPSGKRLTPSVLAIVQNRELQIMKMLDHGNVTTLHHYFYTEGEKAKRCPRTLPELHSAFSALPRARTLAPPAPRRVPDRLAPAPFAHRSLTRPT